MRSTGIKEHRTFTKLCNFGVVPFSITSVVIDINNGWSALGEVDIAAFDVTNVRLNLPRDIIVREEVGISNLNFGLFRIQ